MMTRCSRDDQELYAAIASMVGEQDDLVHKMEDNCRKACLERQHASNTLQEAFDDLITKTQNAKAKMSKLSTYAIDTNEAVIDIKSDREELCKITKAMMCVTENANNLKIALTQDSCVKMMRVLDPLNDACGEVFKMSEEV